MRYFITYFIHFALKYILILFITFSRECHAKTENTTCSLRCEGKRLRSQTKEVVANVYEYFKEIHRCRRTQGSLKELLMPREFHVPASRVYRKRKLRLFVKRFFSEPQWLYSCLKSQKTKYDYYFNSYNYYNRTSVHIIKTV